MKKAVSSQWLDVGKGLAIISSMFSVIRDYMVGSKIGPQFLVWLTSHGKQTFFRLLDQALTVFTEELMVNMDTENVAYPVCPSQDQIVGRASGKHLVYEDSLGFQRPFGDAEIGRSIFGRLHGKPVCRINLLFFLQKRPYLIPAHLQGMTLFAWGTVLFDQHKQKVIAGIKLAGEEWIQVIKPVDSYFLSDQVALLFEA
jgi:hypothetical protein